MKRDDRLMSKSKAAGRATKRRSVRYSTLTARGKAEYGRSIDLLYDLRHGGKYANLLRKHHLSTHKAQWYLGSNLIVGTRGKRVRASKTDRLTRALLFPTHFG